MRGHTFYHLHVVRNEGYIILYFEARMSRIFKDKISSACIDKDLCNRQVRRSWIYEPFSTTVGLTYTSGALTATWAKLRGFGDHSIDREIPRQTSGSHRDVPGRHSMTRALEYRSLQELSTLEQRRKRGFTNTQSIRPP